MWVNDPGWVGLKLAKLLNYSEPELDFFYWVPGNGKQANYTSSVAYIAHAVLHRYKVLGHLDADGRALRGGLAASSGQVNVHKTQAQTGRKCPECGQHALRRKDGCDFCDACGHSGTCG